MKMTIDYDDDEIIAMATTDDLGDIDESLKPKPPPKPNHKEGYF